MRRPFVLVLFVGLLIVAPFTALPPPTSAQLGCDLVELRPGYPGYRGIVPGLIGSGEVACLEDLRRADPAFDRALEDLRNQQAAQQLGITGSPIDWPWELWMLVGAERGYGYLCYSCAVYGAYPIGARLQSLAGPKDPRLLLPAGGEDYTFAFRVQMEEFGQISRGMLSDWMADGMLRVLAFLASWPAVPEMSVVVDQAGNVVRSAWCSPGPGCGVALPSVCGVVERGGYVISHSAMSPSDQYFILAMGVLAVANYSYAPISQMTTESAIDRLADTWLLYPDVPLLNLAREAFGC